MEIIFNCPNCEQELSVDGEGAGSEIKCPTCGAKITIPNKPPETASAPPPDAGVHPINPIASSAAAKIEMHLKVPVRDKPGESLVKKAKLPLAVAGQGPRTKKSAPVRFVTRRASKPATTSLTNGSWNF